jgi:hypothetical protein
MASAMGVEDADADEHFAAWRLQRLLPVLLRMTRAMGAEDDEHDER